MKTIEASEFLQRAIVDSHKILEAESCRFGSMPLSTLRTDFLFTRIEEVSKPGRSINLLPSGKVRSGIFRLPEGDVVILKAQEQIIENDVNAMTLAAFLLSVLHHYQLPFSVGILDKNLTGYVFGHGAEAGDVTFQQVAMTDKFVADSKVCAA